MLKKTTAITLLAALGVITFGAQAGVTDDISKAVKDSKVNLELRYRYETNDQNNAAKDATASTLKTRLTVKTGKVSDFAAVIEIDHVATIGADDYWSKAEANNGYSVIADPTGLDLNQAYISYTGFNKTTLSAGRQRLAHNGHRFLGTVGWRQNEQTYDAYRVQVQATDSVNVDYSYIFNANRIFGSDSAVAAGDLHGEFHALNVKYAPAKEHKLAFFAYLLDFDGATADTDTFGVDYKFATKLNKDSKIGVNLSYAMQSDSNDNPNTFDADYYLVEVNASTSGIFGAIGLEVLGSDNGVGFSTPFATLHKFNGWADMFLGTPSAGLEDLYFKVGTKVGGVKLTAVYHDYSADSGSADYGTELDLVAAYQLNKQIGLLAKYASYDAADHGVDTDKLWLMATMKF